LASLDNHLLLVDDSNATVPAIEALLRSLQASANPCGLLIVDYLQLLSSVGRYENRVQEVSAISRGLKKIAQSFDIPVLALSQLRRVEAGNPEPQLHDLKESGQLEQDADQVLFLWLAREQKEGETLREINWKVGKNRDGMVNRGTLDFYTRYCRFVESGAESESAA
jgi:replicative DNA helicase